jgi:predicted nucleic acid-binding protein
VISVIDSGPLMALAKVGGLDVLFRLVPRLVATPAVFAETVTMGQRLGASDSKLLATHFDRGDIEIQAPSIASLPLPAKLGQGEDESIRLAIKLQAEWLLMDDFDARRSAEENLKATGARTQVKGTLGVIVSAHQQGLLPLEEALTLLRSLDERPDVWLSQKLILQVINSLSGGGTFPW